MQYAMLKCQDSFSCKLNHIQLITHSEEYEPIGADHCNHGNKVAEDEYQHNIDCVQWVTAHPVYGAAGRPFQCIFRQSYNNSVDAFCCSHLKMLSAAKIVQ